VRCYCEKLQTTHLWARTSKKQNVAIGILKLESSQSVVRVLQRYREVSTSRRKLCGQRIGIRDAEEGIPSGLWLTSAIRERLYTDRLDHDHRRITTENCKKGLVSRLLKGDLKPELVAIVRHCHGNVRHDEER
jgi:hypothetical protein